MYQPPPPATLATKVSLSFSCKGLLTKDTFSKSDPIVQLLTQDSNQKWREIGRTEHIKNCNDPDFVETIELDYRFEEVQKLKVMVFDVDNATQGLDDDDYLGNVELNLAQVVSSKTLTQKLHCKSSHDNAGTITIVAEELSGGNMTITMQFHATNLDKKDFLGKSDPYLEIQRDHGNGNFDTVHRTPHIDNTLNPRWPTFSISLQKLCFGNYETKLKFKCFDYDSDGSHDLIGECYTTLAEMTQKQKCEWEAINPKKQQKKKNYKNSGVIVLDSIKIVKEHSFLDFIMSGCQINFTVGIDFTASNGDPKLPSSLHYYNGNQPNDYIQALVAVGEICQDYDTDKKFPALGFGARLPPYFQQVSFEFALNFQPSNPYCNGIPEIVMAYQNCVRTVQLYGPTNVAPIINHVMKIGKNIMNGQENTANNYFILLLLTDGAVTDMNDTIHAIVNASYMPVSIIIVGVGGANFDAMEFLDCDNGKLRSPIDGREALRDIVQFVPHRNFKQASTTQQASQAALATAVLAEVPKQVTEYFRLKNIQPNPPPPIQPMPMPTL